MPIYDYHCTACGADTEVMHKISDPPATECPACGKPALIKQMSAAGFRLSGGGWYETDFKAGNKKNLAGEQGGDKAADKPADKPADKGSDKGGATAASEAKQTPAASSEAKKPAEKPAAPTKGDKAA